MTEASIKQKALTVANAFLGTDHATLALLSHQELYFALVYVVEQSEAYKQEVSDAVKDLANDNPVHLAEYLAIRFSTLIDPKPKPDPLVQAMNRLEWCNTDALAKDLRAELDAFGVEIQEKRK
jgi:hypothetical protein